MVWRRGKRPRVVMMTSVSEFVEDACMAYDGALPFPLQTSRRGGIAARTAESVLSC